jgi:hypothetical protein
MRDQRVPISICVAIYIAFFTAAVKTHDLSRSESILEIDNALVRVRFTINLLEIDDVDANRDERVSYEEPDRSIERIFGAITQQYSRWTWSRRSTRSQAPPMPTSIRAQIGGETPQALLTPANRSATFLVPGLSVGRILTFVAAFMLLGVAVWLVRRPFLPS